MQLSSTFMCKILYTLVLSCNQWRLIFQLISLCVYVDFWMFVYLFQVWLICVTVSVIWLPILLFYNLCICGKFGTFCGTYHTTIILRFFWGIAVLFMCQIFANSQFNNLFVITLRLYAIHYLIEFIVIYTLIIWLYHTIFI